jgi:hypothetical protein
LISGSDPERSSLSSSTSRRFAASFNVEAPPRGFRPPTPRRYLRTDVTVVTHPAFVFAY